MTLTEFEFVVGAVLVALFFAAIVATFNHLRRK